MREGVALAVGLVDRLGLVAGQQAVALRQVEAARPAVARLQHHLALIGRQAGQLPQRLVQVLFERAVQREQRQPQCVRFTVGARRELVAAAQLVINTSHAASSGLVCRNSHYCMRESRTAARLLHSP